jgi:acetyl-CoA acyltransferase
MSYIPMGGFKVTPEFGLSQHHTDYYNNMGLTAEAVANKYNISREDQDLFALQSHDRALNAIKTGRFKDEIVPINVEETFLDENHKKQTRNFVVDNDEGPRAGSTPETLARLRPVFAQGGSVTAANSSQTSDGAAFVMVMSEAMVKELNVEPIARFVSYAAAGVEPRIMGIGPVEAIPKALKQAGLKQDDIDLIELNEAFAAQSLAVIRELGLNQEKVNVNGGAIALGHPLGCTGGKLSVQVLNELKKTGGKYGMVTMCVGTGQGAAGIYEML